MLALPHCLPPQLDAGHALLAATSPAQAGASAPVLAPVLILVLCVAAGLGTLMLLPSRRQTPLAKIGGALLLAAGLVFGAVLIRFAAAREGGVHFYFWVFALIALGGAVRVVTHPRPVYSALYFVLTVFATAGLFILLWAEFMAAALVLIYAGAILVTYVFVIMLASQSVSSDKPLKAVTEYDAVSREPLVAAAVGFTLMGVLLFVIFDKASGINRLQEGDAGGSPVPIEVQGTTQGLGQSLFQNHLVNLELAGLILTVATVGAIVIARRRVLGGSPSDEGFEPTAEAYIAPATPIDDDPHSIPVYGTDNPRQKAYPET